MQAKSIKKNYALSLINSVLGVIFPLITFPYVTRVITPEGIGQVQFFTTINDYIILFTSLGIPLYAVREIAKIRDVEEKRNQLTVDLLGLHSIFTVFGYIAVFVLSLTVPEIKENIPLFLLLSIGIALNTIGVQWFFQAVEDFGYITIRSLIVKVVCLVLLFALVHSKEDLFYYGLVQLLGIGGNYFFNFLRLNKYINGWGKYLKKITLFKHLKPSLRVFLLNVTVGIYTQISFLLLGFMSGNESVGYYSMPFRITSVSLTIITALGAVLLPRFSNLYGSNKKDEFTQLGNKAISFIMAVSLPMFVGLLLLAEPVTLIVCGNEFRSSIIVLRILSPLLFIIGMSQIYGKYMLYSLGKELLMVKCTLFGLIVFLVVGVPAIHFMASKGASLATLCAEFSVTFYMIKAGSKYLDCTMFRRQNINYIISSLIMALVISLILLIKSSVISLALGILLGVISYGGCLMMLHDPFYQEITNIILKRKNNI